MHRLLLAVWIGLCWFSVKCAASNTHGSFTNTSCSNLASNSSTPYSSPMLSSKHDTSTSHPVGFYVAAGLGISSSPASQALASSTSYPAVFGATSSPSRPPMRPTGTDRTSVASARLQHQSKMSATSTTSSSIQTRTFTRIETVVVHTASYNASNMTITHTALSRTVVVNSTSTGWANVSNADQCWTQWQSWWAMSMLTTDLPTYVSVSPYSATGFTTTEVLISSAIAASTSTVALSYETYTEPDIVNGFTVGSWTGTYTQTPATWTYPAQAGSTVTTVVAYGGVISTVNFTTLTPSNGFPTPSCRLPSSYSKCQSQWESWATIAVSPFPALPQTPG